MLEHRRGTGLAVASEMDLQRYTFMKIAIIEHVDMLDLTQPNAVAWS